MPPFNLLRERWIPVRRQQGGVCQIAPAEISSDYESNPILDFAWPRPDFDLACHELLIGLLAGIYAELVPDPGDWQLRYATPPEPGLLDVLWRRFEAHFDLDQGATRFLQECNLTDAQSLQGLMIEAPGAITIKENRDFFTKRKADFVLSRAGAAMALYTLQQYCPIGGIGRNAAMRNGGPLVTLVLPSAGQQPASLWQRLWLHTPDDRSLAPHADASAALPWLNTARFASAKGQETASKTKDTGKTKDSRKGQVPRPGRQKVHESDADMHPLHCFFGMPRRIELQFADNPQGLACSITGNIDSRICTGFRTAGFGYDYGLWRHPLSAYRLQTLADKTQAINPVGTPDQPIGYDTWLGAVHSEGADSMAAAVALAMQRLRWMATAQNAEQSATSSPASHAKHPGSGLVSRYRLKAAGFSTFQASLTGFQEASMPFYVLPAALEEPFYSIAKQLVQGSALAAALLGIASRIGLYGSNGLQHKKGCQKGSLLSQLKAELWHSSEAAFYASLDTAIASLAWPGQDHTEIRQSLAAQWRQQLADQALDLYDNAVPVTGFNGMVAAQVVHGRRLLNSGLNGYGSMGKKFFTALDLPLPSATGSSKAAAPVGEKHSQTAMAESLD